MLALGFAVHAVIVNSSGGWTQARIRVVVGGYGYPHPDHNPSTLLFGERAYSASPMGPLSQFGEQFEVLTLVQEHA